MPVKDHYRTLGIAATASIKDIKTAFRKLAHQYHPDKNGDQGFGAARFRDIQQAYHILSDLRRKKAYDEERYFAGLAATKEPRQLTAAWLLQQARSLNLHTQRVDSYTLNHKALHDYIVQLLSDGHLGVLQQEDDVQIRSSLLQELLQSVQQLDYHYFSSLIYRFNLLAGADDKLQEMIRTTSVTKRRKKRADKYLPLVAIAIALLLCYAMYYYGRK